MTVKIKFSHEFFIYYGANSMLARNEHQRRGQFLFNCLAEFRPELAEKLRGLPLDPYHNDSQIDAACLWIEENWTR
jgi:hypothetical protein